MIKILYSVVDSDATGCQRLIYPLAALKQKYGVEYEVLNTFDVKTQLRKADILWMQCLVGPQQRELIDYAKKQGVKVVIDYDDCFSELPTNIQKRFEMSQTEITENWSYYLQTADLITVPCDSLVKEISKLSRRPVAVLPNLIQKSTYQESKDYEPFKDTSELRILYSCSESHLADFKFIVPVLLWCGRIFRNVQILTNGGLNFSYHAPYFKGKSLHISKVSYGAYYSTLRKYQPHIFLAPVMDNTYNRCRSDLKFSQAAVLKAAFLGSDIGTYSSVIDGNVGLLSSNFKAAWLWNLAKLVNNPSYAQQLGKNAYEELQYNLLEDRIDEWHFALTGL